MIFLPRKFLIDESVTFQFQFEWRYRQRCVRTVRPGHSAVHGHGTPSILRFKLGLKILIIFCCGFHSHKK